MAFAAGDQSKSITTQLLLEVNYPIIIIQLQLDQLQPYYLNTITTQPITTLLSLNGIYGINVCVFSKCIKIKYNFLYNPLKPYIIKLQCSST